MAFDSLWRGLRRRRDGSGLEPERAPALVVLRDVPSSHRLARRIVREYVDEGSTPPVVDLFAHAQSAGHGRRARPWSSPPGGGVYASLVRPLGDVAPERLPVLVPVALAETLGRRLESVRVKWPNDLVVAGRKLGGILVDVTTPAEGSPVAVVSFGVNLDADLERFAQPRATSLGAEGADRVDPEVLAAELAEAVDRVLASDAHDLVERYRALSTHRAGDALAVRAGEETISGTFEGFDERGFLRLLTPDGERILAAGELSAEEPSAEELATEEASRA